MEDIHYLYKITNLVNGKGYIGVTKNPKERKKCHFKKKVDRLISKAINKYGKDSFSFDLLVAGPKEYIYSIEESAIHIYKTHVSYGTGYNIAQGGCGGSKPRRGKVSSRKDDKAVYVAGFWFPNKRTALASLMWTDSKFRYRKAKGILGDTYTPFKTVNSRNSVKTSPVYYRGFWFPGADIASIVYNINVSSLKRDIRNRRYEEVDSIQHYKIVKKHLVFGEIFDSIEDAANFLGISVVALKGRYNRKSDPLNYSFTYIKQEV